MSELSKHGLGDAVMAVAVNFESVANTRLGDKIQKLYGLLLCIPAAACIKILMVEAALPRLRQWAAEN